MSTPSPAGLEDRYGATRRSPRWVPRAGAALLLVALTAFVVWAGVSHATKSARGGIRSFATTESSLTVTLEVRKPAGRGAVCTVTALGAEGQPVGRAEVPVAARQRVVTTTLVTSGPPRTAELDGCRLR